MVSTVGDPNTIAFVTFDELIQGERELLEAARKGLDDVPPDNFNSGASVAAAVQIRGVRRPIVGTNIENDGPNGGICAERTALATAHNTGRGDRCVALAIVTRSPGGEPTVEIATPCGACRDVITRFADRSGLGGKFTILSATTDFDQIIRTTIGDLLPMPFRRASLDSRSRA